MQWLKANKKVCLVIYAFLLLLIVIYHVFIAFMGENLYFRPWVNFVVLGLMVLLFAVIPVIYAIYTTIESDEKTLIKIMLLFGYIFVILFFAFLLIGISFTFTSYVKEVPISNNYKSDEEHVYVRESVWLETCDEIVEFKKENIFLMRYDSTYKYCPD